MSTSKSNPAPEHEQSNKRTRHDDDVEVEFDKIVTYEPNELATFFLGWKNRSPAIPNINSQKINHEFPTKMVVAAIQLYAHLYSSPSDPLTLNSLFLLLHDYIVKAVVEHKATVILLPELFFTPYFCQSQDSVLFESAQSDIDDVNADCGLSKNLLIGTMQVMAKDYDVVIPVSIFEKQNNTFYNTVVMIDADGKILGKYRKSHIPDGPGYQEKFYFSPGDTGFKVFQTKVGKIGVGICWDQWFPECARSMTLMGADVLLYPTTIGSEPQDPTLDSSDHWQRVMQGHSAANVIPIVACNRFGTEVLMNQQGEEVQRNHYYGRSFITDVKGAIIKEAKNGSDIISCEIDIEANRDIRTSWGIFRDRRPELYNPLLTKDGHTRL